ncbi:MAG: beta-galactosidase [bacterium]
MKSTLFQHLYHGAAYYPELWPDKIDEDIRLMKEVGIDLVRVGEFAWSKMEPEDGQFTFEWIEEVLDKTHAAGISTILCTPTPTPPVWLTEKYPEVLYVDRSGRRHVHGSRQHICPSSTVFRMYSRRIVRELAQRFGRHPGVIGWQTDNEFYCHNPNSFSEAARHAWHEWLRNRYGTIEALNQAWNADIWSETYQRFEQVPQPTATPFGEHNCSLESAYKRFGSDSIVEFQKEQIDIIHEYSDAPVTHDAMPPWHPLDNDDLFEDLDFCAANAYMPHDSLWKFTREFDWLRVRKPGKPFVILETSPCYNGSVQAGHGPHPDGFLRVEGLTTLGLGATGFSYWLWRQQRGGAEMVHGSVISASGKPTIGWRNVKQLSEAIRKAEDFLLAVPPARAEFALHYSTRSKFILRTEPMIPGFDEIQIHWEESYRPILEAGIYRDIIFERADVSSYRTVFTPYMPVIDEAILAKMEAFVRAGGCWIVGPMSGYRTEEHTVHTDRILGGLEQLAGVETLYEFPIHQMEISGKLEKRRIALKGWAFAFSPVDAKPMGKYENGPAAKEAWITERDLEKGKIILLGAAPDHPTLAKIFKRASNNTPYKHTTDITWGSLAAPREGNNRSGWIIVNWDGKGGKVTLPTNAIDHLTNKELPAGPLNLNPYDAYVLEWSNS